MFRKSDKYLYWAKWIIVISHILSAVMLIVLTVLYIKEFGFLACLILAGGLLGLLISWVFSFLFLSYLWDIKKIRNRLYDENDVMLNSFFDN